ncbi:MAG: hypothetical protein AAF657_22620, partial [Acidobacteriota bacterium]
MRLERLPSLYRSGTVHRSPSLDLRFPRRRTVRPAVVVAPEGREPKPPLLHSELFPDEAESDRKLARWALLVALVFHGALLWVVLPELDFWPERERPERIRTVFVVQPTRFRAPPPPPPAGGQPQSKQRKKLIPVPDLTPDLPEPLLMDLPEIEFPEIDLPVEIPPGPGGPASTPAVGGGGPGGGDGWA